MVSLGISEFSFGFAFLYEQARKNWSNLKAAPMLPSLQQEADLGWDACLPLRGTDFYYQFKLCEYMSRSNSEFIKKGPYTSAYFRARLHRHRKNEQHRLLKKLAQAQPNTFYVVPQARSKKEFNDAFLKGQVLGVSRLIPLTDCDEIKDGKQHWITFQEGEREWIQHSNMNRHERSIPGVEMENLYRATSKDWQNVDLQFANRVLENASGIVSRPVKRRRKVPLKQPIESVSHHGDELRPGDLLWSAGQLLWAHLGINLVIVGANPEAEDQNNSGRAAGEVAK